MIAFWTSLAFVVLAEMGDKTQLLAMAFAARIRWQTVMWGVFWATAANHLLAVLVGNYLTHLIPLVYIKIAAAVSFIIFGLWTIRGDKLEDEDKRFNFSPFWTVAIAFFLAEMGDKTQLATIALAADFSTVVPVWAGTTAGMLIADAIGIVAASSSIKSFRKSRSNGSPRSRSSCSGCGDCTRRYSGRRESLLPALRRLYFSNSSQRSIILLKRSF